MREGKRVDSLKRSSTPTKGSKTKSGEASTEDDKATTQLRAELKENRKKIGICKSPKKTLWLMVLVCKDYARAIWSFLLSSNVVKFLLIPLVASWVFSKFHLPELHKGPHDCANPWDVGVLWMVEVYIWEAAWWIVLGILSSVGFGTGLHSGVMFLFPHIMKVVFASDACGTLDGLITLYEHPCKLDCITTRGAVGEVTFLAIFLRVTVPCMLWGFGTAAGELPPYAVSKAARLAGKSDDEFETEMAEAKSSSDPLSRMKVWTIGFTERYGFLGVLALAAWPNAAFDMCGMCCGYLLMPFWTFFIATLLGKGLIKVNGQAIFFILLFGRTFFDNAVLPVAAAVSGVVAKVSGAVYDLEMIARQQRSKVINVFEKHIRYTVDQMFQGTEALDHNKTEALYSKFGTSQEVHDIATRVISQWDANGDKKISKSEVTGAVSGADRKISLSSLDPSAQSMMGRAWELCILGLVLFFLVSIIDQLAAAKQIELDEAEIRKRSDEDTDVRGRSERKNRYL